MPSPSPLQVLTIGHSNMALEVFLERLLELGVEMVVDLRSYPHTQLQPWFKKRKIKMSLFRRGIVYCYLGAELGGRPKESGLRGRDGAVDWRLYERSERFQEGIAWLLEQAGRYRICLLGGPGEPENCHRHRLVAQALLAHGCAVHHVLPSGTLREAQADLYHYQAACDAEGGKGSLGPEKKKG